MVKGGGIGLAGQLERSLQTRVSPFFALANTARREPGTSGPGAYGRAEPSTGGSDARSPHTPHATERDLGQSVLASLDQALLSSAPAPARVSSGFGTRRDPFTGLPAHHGGVDLAEQDGAPIMAVLGGVVTSAGERGGYGRAVEIDHGGGVTTLYAHASELLVQPGDRVTPGQRIARVGHTGRATGAHLHFEVRVGGKAVDPGVGLKIRSERADDASESGS